MYLCTVYTTIDKILKPKLDYTVKCKYMQDICDLQNLQMVKKMQVFMLRLQQSTA